MTNSTEEIQNHRVKAQASLNKTAEFQQVLAQIEAAMSRKEHQKASKKSKTI